MHVRHHSSYYFLFLVFFPMTTLVFPQYLYYKAHSDYQCSIADWSSWFTSFFEDCCHKVEVVLQLSRVERLPNISQHYLCFLSQYLLVIFWNQDSLSTHSPPQYLNHLLCNWCFFLRVCLSYWFFFFFFFNHGIFCLFLLKHILFSQIVPPSCQEF